MVVVRRASRPGFLRRQVLLYRFLHLQLDQLILLHRR